MLGVLKHKRFLLGAVAVAGLVAVAAWPKPTEVDMATVERGPLVVTVDEEGETRVRERFVVSAPVAGELLRVGLEPGDAVRAKSELAVIRPAGPGLLDARERAGASAAVHSADATLSRARAERDRARTTLERARQQLDRARGLFQAGAVSRDEFEARDADARVAEEAFRSADFSVAEAQYNLQAARARMIQGTGAGAARDVVVTAPVDGVVLKRHRESQTVVPAGEPLLEVGDPSRLEIVADFLSSDAVKVHPGQPVLIEQWGGGQTLRGRVRRIEPSGFLKVSALGVEEQRVNIIIDFDDPGGAWRALGDAFRVEVRVVIWRQDPVLKVPTGALFRRADQWAVFAVQKSKTALRPVVVGQRNGTDAQVVSGLAEGDRVVLYPPDTLTDGKRVVALAK